MNAKTLFLLGFIILSLNPIAFIPLASDPIIHEAYAQSTQFLGSERGDTWKKDYYQDGNQILVQQTFGLPEFVNTSEGYKAYHITQTPTEINVNSKVTPLTFDKNNCTNTFHERNSNNVFIENEYWSMALKPINGSWFVFDALTLACDYTTGNNNEGKTLTVHREHAKGNFYSEYTLKDDGTLTKPFLTFVNNPAINQNGTNGLINTKVSFANIWDNTKITKINYDGIELSGAQLANKFPVGEDVLITKANILNKIINFETSDGNTFIYDTTLGYADLIALQVTRNPDNTADLVWVYGATSNYLTGGETVTLDPEVGYTPSASTMRYFDDTNNNGSCDVASSLLASGNPVRWGMANTASSTDCSRGYFEVDISSFDNSNEVYQIDFDYEISTVDGDGSNFDIAPMASQPSIATNQNAFDDIGDGTDYVSNVAGTSTGTNLNTDLGASAVSDFNTAKDASQSWFAIGIRGAVETQTANHQLSYIAVSGGTPQPTLTVFYTVPITPNAPTNDGVTNFASNTNLQYDWTLASNFDNATQPAVTSSNVYVGDTKYLNTPFKNQNATQETDIGAINTSSNFEGIFHFDSLTEAIYSYGGDISTSVYLQALTTTETPDARGGEFVESGSTLFLVDSTSQDVEKWSCSTPYDVSTCSYDSNKDISGQEATPEDVVFNNDGTKMFIVGRSGVEVNEYSCSTGYLLSSCSFVDAYSISEEGNPTAIDFNDDGTKMYISGYGTDDVFQYSCTAFDVSTCSYDSVFLNSSTEDDTMIGMQWASDGSIFYMVSYGATSSTEDLVYEYPCSTDYDLSSCSYSQSYNYVSTTQATDVFFNDDGTKMYLVDFTNGQIDEFDLDAGSIISPSKTYDYSGNDDHGVITVLEATPTHNDDMLTNPSWTTSATSPTYDGTNDEMDLTDASSSYRYGFATLPSNACDGMNDCVIRGEVTRNNDPANTSNGGRFQLVLTNTLSDTYFNNNDSIMLGHVQDHSSAGACGTRVFAPDNQLSYQNQGSLVNANDCDNHTDGTKFYWSIIKSGTSITGKICTTDYVTGCWTDATVTASGSQTGMIYLGLNNQLADTNRASTQWSLHEISLWDGTTDTSGTATLKISNIDTGFSNEVQFDGSGLNVTSSNYPINTNAWTLQGLVTLNQTNSLPLLSFDSSGSEVLCNVSLTFIGCSKGGTDLFNHTLSTPLSIDTPQAITLKRSTGGVYETFINGTRSPDSSTTDTTSLGTATNNLYHFGFDTSLSNGGTWRLDELAILSTEQSDQDDIDFGNRLNPFSFQDSVSAPTVSYTHTGLGALADKCFYATAVNSVGESDPSGIECGTTTAGFPTYDPVTSITLDSSTYNSANISWSLPASNGATFKLSMINYTTPWGTATTFWANNTSISDLDTVLTGLLPETDYSVQVAIFSGNETADWGGTRLDFTTPSIPTFSPVTPLTAGTIGANSAEVSWGLPASNGATFKTYMVNTTSPHGVATTFYQNTTSNSITITGLSILTDYSVQVGAFSTLETVDWGGYILNFTTNDYDPPGTPTLTGLALSDQALRFTSVPGTAGHNATIWYSMQCELNGAGGWVSVVTNSSYVSFKEVSGLTVGDVYICQWRDGSVDGWSGWSNNATDILQLSVISGQRTIANNPDDKLLEFINFISSQGGVWFGLGAIPFAVMLIGFMAGKKTVRIFTLITLSLMGIIHASGYYVYPDWYWGLALFFGIGLIMGRAKSD